MTAAERRDRVDEVLRAVGLPEAHLRLYPHEISGGQQRRVGLARILALRPGLVILDEPTSGLDVSVQANVLGLLADLRSRFDLTYLFISHDLSVVRLFSRRIAVMYLGRVVELGLTRAVFETPRHPYTRSLLAAVPAIGGRRVTETMSLDGEPPSRSLRLPVSHPLLLGRRHLRARRSRLAHHGRRVPGGVPLRGTHRCTRA
jgi:ABC-type oligopeptide transport system ATPase subunit